MNDKWAAVNGILEQRLESTAARGRGDSLTRWHRVQLGGSKEERKHCIQFARGSEERELPGEQGRP